MFRLQNNVPNVYVDKSRDFQLFCRAYDSVFNGVKYSVDSLSHTSITSECNNTLLSLLADKLGLFTRLNLPDTELRYVLGVFPLLIRNKGSSKAIEYTVRVFQRIAKINNLECEIHIDNNSREIKLTFSSEISNDDLLYELLSYIIPTGYICIYDVFKNDLAITRVVMSQSLEFASYDPSTMSVVYHIDNFGEPPIPSFGDDIDVGLVGDSIKVASGGDIDIAITVRKNTGFSNLKIKLLYDSNLKINTLYNHYETLQFESTQVSGVENCIECSFTGEKDITETGTLLLMNVTLPKDLKKNGYEIALEVISGSNSSGDIVVSAINPKITVVDKFDEYHSLSNKDFGDSVGTTTIQTLQENNDNEVSDEDTNTNNKVEE